MGRFRAQIPAQSTRQSQPSYNPKTQKLLTKAIQQYRNGQLKSAQSSLRTIQRIDPSSVSSFELEAHVALDLGNREQYIQALQSVLDANPASARLQNATGNLLVQVGKMARGIQALEKAHRLDPRSVQFTLDLAAVQTWKGHTPEAIKVLERATQSHPGHAELDLALARLYERLENPTAAAQHYAAMLNQDDEATGLRRLLARNLYHSGQYQQASAEFSRCWQTSALSLSPAECIEYGDACLRMDDFEQAQAVFDGIAKRSINKSREIELLRCVCSLNLGQRTAAKAIIDSALTTWPDDNDFRQLLSLCDTEAAG